MKLILPEQSILRRFSLGYIHWSSVLNFLKSWGDDRHDMSWILSFPCSGEKKLRSEHCYSIHIIIFTWNQEMNDRLIQNTLVFKSSNTRSNLHHVKCKHLMNIPFCGFFCLTIFRDSAFWQRNICSTQHFKDSQERRRNTVTDFYCHCQWKKQVSL